MAYINGFPLHKKRDLKKFAIASAQSCVQAQNYHVTISTNRKLGVMFTIKFPHSEYSSVIRKSMNYFGLGHYS